MLSQSISRAWDPFTIESFYKRAMLNVVKPDLDHELAIVDNSYAATKI